MCQPAQTVIHVGIPSGLRWPLNGWFYEPDTCACFNSLNVFAFSGNLVAGVRLEPSPNECLEPFGVWIGNPVAAACNLPAFLARSKIRFDIMFGLFDLASGLPGTGEPGHAGLQVNLPG